MFLLVYVLLKHIQPLKLIDHVAVYGILLYGLILQTSLINRYIVWLCVIVLLIIDTGLYLYSILFNKKDTSKNINNNQSIYDDITFKTLVDADRESSIIEDDKKCITSNDVDIDDRESVPELDMV